MAEESMWKIEILVKGTRAGAERLMDGVLGISEPIRQLTDLTIEGAVVLGVVGDIEDGALDGPETLKIDPSELGGNDAQDS